MRLSPTTARDPPRPAFTTARHGHNVPGTLRPCPVGPCGYRIRPIRAGEPVFLFLATYHTDADAQLDYAGGVIGHFWNGMSRKDVMELDKALEKAEKEAQ